MRGIYIHIQIWINQLLIFIENFFPLPGFEPRTSRVPSQCATNWTIQSWIISSNLQISDIMGSQIRVNLCITLQIQHFRKIISHVFLLLCKYSTRVYWKNAKNRTTDTHRCLYNKQTWETCTVAQRSEWQPPGSNLRSVSNETCYKSSKYLLYKNMWISCNIEKNWNLKKVYLADFSMLQLINTVVTL